MNYINLHTHTYYSSLDGLNSPEEYMVRAKELGMTHLAITDHGTLSGHRDFQVASKAAGITAILGMEGYISPTDRFDKRSTAKREDGTSVYNHITLLAQNAKGLETLNRLSAEAYRGGYYFKPRIDTELLFSDNEGIIVLSGCMSGLIAKAIEREDLPAALKYAEDYKGALGDRFFIEVMSSNEAALNIALLDIADKAGVRSVMTTDCHYANKDDLWVEEAMLILSTQPLPNRHADLTKAKQMDFLDRLNYLYPERRISFQEIEIYLRDHQTEVEGFTKQGITRTDIYENTLDIAKGIGEYPFYEGLDLLPKPVGHNSDELLEEKVGAGLRRRGLDKDPASLSRIYEEELPVIKSKNFSPYFIAVEDIVTWAKSRGIRVGPGRGSAVGSMINYVLGITDINPIKYGLLSFRFIDPTRDDRPDIDLDFPDNRRAEVKEYTRLKYEHVASIATFNAFGGKSSIKKAASVFRTPLAEVNRATKNNDAPPNSYYFDHFDVSESGREFNRNHPEVIQLAKKLYGRLMGSGMHPSGVVMSSEPIFKYAPMETAKDPNDKAGPRLPMIAYDMNQVADIGFIKMDFLGLKAMTVIDDTLKMIQTRHDLTIDPMDIPLDDSKVYQMLSDGYTKGVFQCEANPYTSLIIESGGVNSFDELAASNALVRPGAKKTIGVEYIARKNGKPTKYVHEDVRWFTEDTYGEVLYQEQVMLMMTELAGMSMSDANKVRSIIGKKKDPAEFEKFKAAFVEGASKKIKKKIAEKLWKDFEAHAGYSFNKSHAVAYSLISYWTAWLKHHYPLEFLAAILRNEDDKHTITDYLIEAKRLGVNIYLPHVNKSGLRIEIENDGLRLGLTNVKYIQDKTGSALMRSRPYGNYAALESKVMEKGSGMNSRALQALNAIGGACFQDNPKKGNERDNFYEYLQIPAFEVKDLPPKVKARFRSLDDYDDTSVFPVLGMVRGVVRKDGWARVEIVDETGSAGIFANQDIPIESGQMYGMLVAKNRVVRYMTMDELADKMPNEFTRYLYGETPEVPEDRYRVITNKIYTTKAGKKMSHLIMMDHLGLLKFVMAFPQQYNLARIQCPEGAVVNALLDETSDGSLHIKEILHEN